MAFTRTSVISEKAKGAKDNKGRGRISASTKRAIDGFKTQ